MATRPRDGDAGAPNDASLASIMIVTGAHPTAEVFDRPIAYALREHIRDRLTDLAGDEPGPEQVLVLCDLWYLNQQDLRALPTIAVGGPGVNALTASLAESLPSILAVEGRMIVQGHFEAPSPLVCCWGLDAATTAAAVESFRTRHLDAFLEAAFGA